MIILFSASETVGCSVVVNYSMGSLHGRAVRVGAMNFERDGLD